MVPLGLTAAAAATNATIQKKKKIGSDTNTLVISDEGMNDIMKTVKSLENSGLLIKDISTTIKNEAKE